MPQFCTECGSAIQPGTVFCVNCGTKVEGGKPSPPAAEPMPIQSQADRAQSQYGGQSERLPDARAVSPGQEGEPYPLSAPQAYPGSAAVARGAQGTGQEAKPLGMLGYLGYLLVMSLPVFGLVMSIVWGVSSKRADRKNLARAMIVIDVISLAVFVVFAVSAYSILTQLSQVVDFGFSILGFQIF